MRIRRLEIFGFKSFRERFVLDFSKDLIGIVGPNGCGKSNVVDALRWVLGETNARHLRGAVQEDLIFSGSDSKNPLGFCEVTVTMRPDEDWQPPLAQIRADDGPDEDKEQLRESEEAAAENSSQQEEVLEGSDIDEQLMAFEVPELFKAAEIEVTRRLYRSGESEYFINRARCRLKDIVDFGRMVGLGPRGLSIVGQGTVGEFIAKKPVERRELLEEAAGISGFRARIEIAERKLKQTKTNTESLATLLEEVSTRERQLKRQANKAIKRAELKKEHRQISTELAAGKLRQLNEKEAQAKGKFDEMCSGINELDKSRIELSASLRSLDERSEQAGKDLQEVKTQRRGLYQEQERIVEAVHKLELDLRTADSSKQQMDSELSHNLSRQEQIRRNVEQSTESLGELERQVTELKAEHASAEQRLASVQGGEFENPHRQRVGELEQELAQTADCEDRSRELGEQEQALRSSMAEVSKELAQLNQSSKELEIERAKTAGLLSSLERQIEEARVAAKQALESSGAEMFSEQSAGDDVRVLLECVVVEPELEKAVAAALGDRANYLVSKKAWDFAESFKRDGKKAVGVLYPLETANQSRVVEDESLSELRLLNFVTVKPGYEELTRELLGDVVLVESLAQGLVVKEQLGSGRAVTRGGEVVEASGWYVPGKLSSSVGLVKLVEEKKGELDVVEKQLTELAGQISPTEERKREFQSRLDKTTSELRELAEISRRRVSLQRALGELEGRVRQFAADKEREAQSKLHQMVKRQASLETEVRSVRARQAEYVAEVDELKRRHSAVSERLQNQKVKVEEITAAIQSERVAIADSQNGLGRQIAAVNTQHGELEKASSQIQREISATRKQVDSINSQRQQLDSQIQQSRIAAERYIVEKELLVENFSSSFADIVLEEIEVELGEDSSIDRYVGERTNKVSQLQVQLDRIGEVDPDSVELYETERQKREDLDSQIGDLERAGAILSRTIGELKQISRARFNDTYQRVSTKFEELIPRLFGGGGGRMELVDPSDPLASGVELIVKPPGKSFRRLDLLSGGEKTLVATAVLLAVFMEHPSPICVLDEVDAPLDDANLDRFNDLLSEISRNTQFLIITHNKQTMASLDRLVGITMQEKGVSTAAEIALEEFEEEQLVVHG